MNLFFIFTGFKYAIEAISLARRAKDNPFHMDRGLHSYRSEIAVEFGAPAGTVQTNIENVLSNESIKRCVKRDRIYKKFATIELAENDIEYYCPLCDTLVLRRFNDKGKMKTEIYDEEHLIIR